VARTDLPALTNITVVFFNQLIFDIPQFCRFISRVGGLNSPGEVVIQPSSRVIGITLTQRSAGNSRLKNECYLADLCKHLDWQLSFSAQILSQLSHLTGVNKLSVYKPLGGLPPATGKEDVDPTQWLELFQPFTHVRDVRVIEKYVA
jgi:hypothetical protein